MISQIVRRLEKIEAQIAPPNGVPEFIIEVAFIGADGGVTGTRRFIVGKAGGTGCAVQSDGG